MAARHRDSLADGACTARRAGDGGRRPVTRSRRIPRGIRGSGSEIWESELRDPRVVGGDLGADAGSLAATRGCGETRPVAVISATLGAGAVSAHPFDCPAP